MWIPNTWRHKIGNESPRFIPFRNHSYCDEPEKRKTVVTIIGGHTGEGQLVALLLKQSKFIDEIRLYSGIINPCGIAVDLSQIDTNPVVKSYLGQGLLRDAIVGAQVVLICGGQAKKPCKSQAELFEENADYVRNAAIYMCEFNPKGMFCISTPPVSSLVPMVSAEFKKEPVYDPRKILGVMTLAVMKSNSIAGRYINRNPADVAVPVIGGMCRRTMVPIFSQIKPVANLQKALQQLLHDKVCSAEDEAVDLKYIENTGSCFISSAFACARFITSVLRGLRGERGIIECAFVRQLGHIEAFLPYMGSVVKFGRGGIESTHMPRINDLECEYLQKAYPYLKRHIEMGEAYIIGDFPKECTLDPRLSGYCQFVSKKPVTQIGDFKIDMEPTCAEKQERCIEIIT
ncbi:hypothetical protein Trydic_g7086 [Trypoxylus dichotomus]